MRVKQVMERLRKDGRKALIPYLMAGDPSPDFTHRAVLELAGLGADMVELGIPFSDPMADGPEIQAAAQRALYGGTTVATVLELVRSIRQESAIPLILMGYYNPIFRYGLKEFAGTAAEAGVDGVIVPDLPLEESSPLFDQLTKVGIDFIPLVAPTTSPDRMAQIGQRAPGLIYCVSRTGVTGTGGETDDNLPAYLNTVRQQTKRPTVVGFGIDGPARAVAAARHADGVVVGSALVRFFAGGTGNPLGQAGELIQTIRSALDGMTSTE